MITASNTVKLDRYFFAALDRSSPYHGFEISLMVYFMYRRVFLEANEMMKKVLLPVIAVLFALFLAAGCGDYSEGLFGGDKEGYPGASSDGPGGSATGDSETDIDGGDDGNEEQNRPKPSQLTAGEWSDIKNYDFYLNLFKPGDPGIDESQKRNDYSNLKKYFGFETRYMVTVNVKSDGFPVDDAAVELYDASENKLFVAKSDKRGNAYLFPSYDLDGEDIAIKVKSGSWKFSDSFLYSGETINVELDGRETVRDVLDLMFVIDTTGSMGDELGYLKSEIESVINSISRQNANHTINLALLFYRDIGDEYVTRYFDFTTNIASQKTNLGKQSANGGGDFPEAVDKALKEAMEKNWSTDNAVRLIFHVLDAPPHDEQVHQTAYYNAVKSAAEKGIRIIPVASSGIDLKTEYLLRQEALMTGGTYIFLTDDSGIGNPHMQPTVGSYTVEYLNACMVRVVNEYLTGVETEPVPYYEAAQ